MLAEGGLDIWIDPDTFLTRIVDFDDLATTRTGAAFGAGVVRFAGGSNIAADLKRAVHQTTYVSHMIVHSSDRLTVEVVEDPDWSAGDPIRYGELTLDTVDVQSADLIIAGLAEIEARKLQTDEATFPVLYGNSESTGLYIPGDLGGTGHYAPGDYVTLHTGSDPGDYDEQTIQVAAVNWVMGIDGLFVPWPELGSKFTSAAAAALDRRLGGVGRGGCPSVCACAARRSTSCWT